MLPSGCKLWSDPDRDKRCFWTGVPMPHGRSAPRLHNCARCFSGFLPFLVFFAFRFFTLHRSPPCLCATLTKPTCCGCWASCAAHEEVSVFWLEKQSSLAGHRGSYTELHCLALNPECYSLDSWISMFYINRFAFLTSSRHPALLSGGVLAASDPGRTISTGSEQHTLIRLCLGKVLTPELRRNAHPHRRVHCSHYRCPAARARM